MARSRFLVSLLTTGYAGYVPAIKSENIFGKTYGKCTHASATGDHDKGLDIPAEQKFRSVHGQEFKNQAQVTYETAAKVVGVNKQADMYQRPLDPTIANGFWGTEDRDEIVDKVNLEKNTQAFFGISGKEKLPPRGPAPQSIEGATEQFYGLPPKKKVEHIAPIPGYSGVSRRVGADNIFGMTYAEARRCADESLHKINDEKGETLKMNATFVPEYNRPPPEDEFW